MIRDNGLLLWATMYMPTGWPKNWYTVFVRFNFVKYWPIFKFISRSESEEHL